MGTGIFKLFYIISLLLALGTTLQAEPLKTYLTSADRARLEQLFENYITTSKDVRVLQSSLAGLQALRGTPKLASADSICATLKSTVDTTIKGSNTDSSSEFLDILYHSTSSAQILGDKCAASISLTPEATALLEKFVTGATSVEKLFYAVATLKVARANVPWDSVRTTCQTQLVADPSAVQYAYAMQIALLSEKSDACGNALHDTARFETVCEDMVGQADTVDNIFLMYEAGVVTTSLVIESVFKFAEKFNRVPKKFNDDNLLKFARYLLGRKHVQQPRAAAQLVRALYLLAHNQIAIPVVATATYPSQWQLAVHVSNVLGEPLSTDAQLELNAIAELLRNTKNNADVKLGKSLTPKAGEAQTYLFDLSEVQAKSPLEPAHYLLYINVAATYKGSKPEKAGDKWVSPDKRLVGLTGGRIDWRLRANLKCSPLDMQLLERDTNIALRTYQLPALDLSAPVRAPTTSIELDPHQKLVLRFSLSATAPLSSAKGQAAPEVPFSPHQVFARFVHNNQTLGVDVYMVIEQETAADKNKAKSAVPTNAASYKFDLDLTVKASDFENQEGDYLMELVIGDPLLSAGFSQQLAKLSLHFSKAGDVTSLKLLREQQAEYLTGPKPEIDHVYRPPDKRAPPAVSTLFDVLVLSPIGLLLILWLRIGPNMDGLSRVPLHAAALFHIALAAVVALYCWFWFVGDMFTTLYLLVPLGALLFLSGHRVLRAIASLSREKEKDR